MPPVRLEPDMKHCRSATSSTSKRLQRYDEIFMLSNQNNINVLLSFAYSTGSTSIEKHLDMTEKNVDCDIKHQHKQTKINVTLL